MTVQSFLLSLDDERQWYRYHQLFAEVLHSRLRQTQPALIPELHRRASGWFGQHQLFDEAITHALAIPDVEHAANLIEQYGLSTNFLSQFQTLLGWLNRLPEALFRTHPILCVTHAVMLTITHQLEQALAQPEGYIRLFLDEGVPMITLLSQAYAQQIMPAYVATLLEAAGERAATDLHPSPPRSNPLLAALTIREREVLRLLMDGASNREIANHLVLSVNTVKKHVLHICRKLGARSRTQAIAQARSLRATLGRRES
jgi:ATP/maltotriose-dependent transcriptional regulator MalT